MTTQTPIVLVDGSSYLYRAFHASFKADMRTKDGRPTGAARVVINMLKSMMRAYPDSTVVVIFDAKGKTFRDDIYDQYKANRPPMPDDLREQIEPIHGMIKAMGLPLIMIDGVEADDVIGTYAQMATKAGRPIVVSTGDKDMAQLVNEHVTLVNTMTDTVMDIAGVNEKFGLPPELIIDFLALMGDKVDNIPGVAGVGEKTALALLQNLGGLDAIYNDLEKVATLDIRGAKKLPQKLAGEKESAYLSYELATIKCDVELPLALEQLEMQAVDNDALLQWFKTMEFRSWIAELEAELDGGEPQAAAPEIERDYQCITDKASFEKWMTKLKQAKVFAFDTETTSLNYMEAELVGLSFAVAPFEAAYVPLTHDYMGAPDQLDRDWVLAQLQPLLESPEYTKVGQNLKYDMHVLRHYGVNINAPISDTMLASYVLNSTATRHDMDSLAARYLDESTISFEEIAGKGAKQLTFNQIELEQAVPYACEDADITLRLHQYLQEALQSLPEQQKLLQELEQPLVNTLCDMEHLGTYIDSERLQQQSLSLDKTCKELEKQAYDLAGEPFNLGSPKQLQAILFEKLGLPVIKKTPKGQPSTAEPVLQELADDYPLPALIMEYRSLSKLKSTYTDALVQQVNAKTGRVHTSYHQAVTATGRLSSSNPNLQNIPIRTEEGRKVRQAFIAGEGKKIVAADYSQIELRIMAHLSKDGGLLGAFNNQEDVHRATAGEVFGVAKDEVSNDQRRKAKAINFGLIYGMSAFGLAKQLKLGRNEAQEYIDRYFEKYPDVKQYMDDVRVQAAEDGFVATIMGRRLYLPDINAKNGMKRQAAERTAINAPMQGSAADIIKKAMLEIAAWLEQTTLDVKLLMQVHDELVFEIAEADVEAACAQIKACMEGAVSLSVPLVVDVGVGDNWDEAH